MFARQALMRSCLLLIACFGVGSVVYAAEPLEGFPTSHCLRRNGPEEMSAECCQAYAGIELRQKKATMEKAGGRFSRRQESDSPPIAIKISEGYRRSEYMRVICDLNARAIQTDTTRVCTHIGPTPNGVSYPELGRNDQHHSTTHHNNNPEKVRKLAAITAFNIEQFTDMVKKMRSLHEGDGTLPDNCTMLRGSGLEAGDRNMRAKLTFSLAGHGGGSIGTGRFGDN